MEKELTYTESDITSHFNFIFKEFNDDNTDLFQEKGSDTIDVHISSFEDLKDSIDNLLRYNQSCLVIDHLNVIELCELIYNAMSTGRKIHISIYSYASFDIAKENMINIFPSYSDNQSLISHMLYNKFDQTNKICQVIFDFYLRSCSLFNFFENKEIVNHRKDLVKFLKENVTIKLINFS